MKLSGNSPGLQVSRNLSGSSQKLSRKLSRKLFKKLSRKFSRKLSRKPSGSTQRHPGSTQDTPRRIPGSSQGIQRSMMLLDSIF